MILLTIDVIVEQEVDSEPTIYQSDGPFLPEAQEMPALNKFVASNFLEERI